MKNSYFQYLHMRNLANFKIWLILANFYSAGCHGNGACKQILTKFMLLLGGHNHCVKVSSDSETVRGMGLWEFSGALRELMLSVINASCSVSVQFHYFCILLDALFFVEVEGKNLSVVLQVWKSPEHIFYNILHIMYGKMWFISILWH